MAIDLLPNRANQENAGSYAGLLASSFMIGRALSSYTLGKCADQYGRTTVLYSSLVLSSIFSVLFGASQSFPAALVFRFLLGLSNGIIGTSKTLVSELANGNQVLETRGMALVIGMRGWGFLLSPAIGGSLAEVVKQYPNVPLVIRFQGFLSKYPFLLPNIVGAFLCIVSWIAVYLWVKETLPKEQLTSPRQFAHDCIEWMTKMFHRLCVKKEETIAFKYTSLKSYSSSYQDDDCIENGSSLKGMPTNPKEAQKQNDDHPTMSLIWSRTDTRRHLIVYWFYSFVIISVDEAFPLFCISRAAGLGLSESAIGKVLSISGLIFVVCQYFTYTSLVHWFGIYRSITVGTFITIPAVSLIPFSLLFQSTSGDLTLSLLCYLGIVMALYRIFANAFFASITIATNRTVPASYRASVNGLSQLGASVCKGIGPTLTGLFVAFSFSSRVVSPHIGATVVFGVLSLLALLVAVPAATHLEPTAITQNGDANGGR